MSTIAEATAINTVLNYFLELDQDDDPTKAREACAYLADRADKALHAGLRSADVIAAWPLEDKPTEEAPAPPKCQMCGRERTPLDAYDYNPLQVITHKPVGWYSGDDGEICQQCMANLLSGQIR